MKTKFSIRLTAIAVVVVLSSQISNGLAQDQEPSGGLVTVLDVAAVFDANPSFKMKMDNIKAEADGLKTQIEAEQTKIREDAMKLQDYEVGTPDRNRMEGDLEKRQTELRTRARQSEQELLNREAIIYYDTYRLMQDVVTSVAQENNIAMVLRFDSAEIDKSNRAEVIKGVNRTVVYHNKLDLTKLVTAKMNERTAAAGSSNAQR